MDILKYLCLNYSHVPSVIMSVNSVLTEGGRRVGGGARPHTAHSFLLTCMCFMSVFLDRNGVSNDGQMSTIGIFTFNVI